MWYQSMSKLLCKLFQQRSWWVFCKKSVTVSWNVPSYGGGSDGGREKIYGISPAMLGSRSASSAEAAAQETLGKRYTPATFDSSRLLILGREKRLTTFMLSPTI